MSSRSARRRRAREREVERIVKALGPKKPRDRGDLARRLNRQLLEQIRRSFPGVDKWLREPN
jgi:hypothetical protein